MRDNRTGAHGGQQEGGANSHDQGFPGGIDLSRLRSRLPQDGVWFDDELAAIFKVETQSVREHVYRYRIPYTPAFRQILIDMKDFLSCGKVVPAVEEPEAPPQKKSKK